MKAPVLCAGYGDNDIAGGTDVSGIISESAEMLDCILSK